MNAEKLSKLRRAAGAVCAALIALCGISYIVAAVHLYYTGGAKPYSADSVGRYLLYLLPISALTVISAALSGVLSVISDDGKAKLRGAADTKAVLGKFYRRYRVTAIDRRAIGAGNMALVTDPENYGKIVREMRLRRIAVTVFALTCALVIGGALIPLLSPSSYNPSSDALNSTVITLALWSLPPAIAVIGGSLILSDILNKSFRSELDMIKSLVASSSPSEAPITKHDDGKLTGKIYTGVRIAVVIAALSLIVTGIVTGDVENIIDKAVRICQECIGIG